MRPIFDRFRDYDFQFWVAVQAESGEPAKIHRLFGFFGKDECNKWFDIRQRRHEVAGYVSDLAIASGLADAAALHNPGDRATAIGLQVRYALISTTLRELAYNHSPNLVARYLRAKVWTGEQALTWARLNGNPQQAVETAVAMLRMSTADARPELWAEALELGGSIGDADNKVLGIAAFAGDLPPYLQMRALELIKAEKHEGSRRGGLAAFIGKPGISPRILEEALEVARNFERDDLRSEALAAIGSVLNEPEQTRAFQSAIDLLHQGLQKPVWQDLWRQPRFIRWLPLSMISDLIADPRFEQVRDSSTLEYVERKTKSDPLEAFARLKDAGSYIPDDLLERLAEALAGAQRFDDALFCLKSSANLVVEQKARAIGRFLPVCPPHLQDEAIGLLKDVRPEDRVACLRELARAPSVSKNLVRQVADASLTEHNENEVRVAMARFLAPEEREALVHVLASDKRWSSRPFADLAPHLPIEMVRFGLDAANAAASRDGYIALLVRLADLGHQQEAINRAGAATSSYYQKELFEVLAANVSEDAIGAIATSIRPNDISERLDLAKIALLPSLPDSEARQTFGKLHHEFSVLAALVDQVSSAELVHVYPLILEEMRKNMTDTGSIERELPRTVALLSRALKRLPCAPVIQKAVVELSSKQFEPALKLDLLLGLAESCDDAAYVRVALQGALALAKADADLTAYLNIGMRVAAAHPACLNGILEEIDDPEALAPFLALSSATLDAPTRQRALERVAAIAEPWPRLQALRSLWRYLDEEEQRFVAVRERAKPEWLEDDQLFVWLMTMLSSPTLEDIAGREIARARRFQAMPVREKIATACWIADITAGYREYFDPAFAAITSLEPDEQIVAISRMAPWLTAEQIRSAYETLDMLEGKDLTPTIAELVNRSLHLEDGRLALNGLNRIEDRYTRSGVITEVADLLPVEVLEMIAFSARDDGFMGGLASGTLVPGIRAE